MQLARTARAVHPRQFGRGPRRLLGRELQPACPAPRASMSDDLKLFATTFAAGFVFVSVFIG
jgi:hypothetical protein